MDIGIMQGRIYPQCLERLQLFPKHKWEKELVKANNMGFNNLELLFDKDLYCKTLLDNRVIQKKLIKPPNSNNKFSIKSINIDYFSSIKTFDGSNSNFLDMLYEIIALIKETSIKTLVIPYCDENSLDDLDDLYKVLEIYKESNIDELMISNNLFLSLELGLPAKLIKDGFDTFSFKNIGICYDLGNAAGLGFKPEKEILILNDLINHIHIKDKSLNGTNVMLGNGDVNFKECMNSLKKINFNGCLVLETIYKNNPCKEAEKNFHFIKNIINS